MTRDTVRSPPGTNPTVASAPATPVGLRQAPPREIHPANADRVEQYEYRPEPDLLQQYGKREHRDEVDPPVAHRRHAHARRAHIAAYQAVRGVAFMTAVTFAAEIGDVCRFDNPRQLMAYLGLVPSENSTGERVRRGSLTKSGNRRARRALIEGGWAYRFPARISPTLQQRLNGLPKGVREIAWKAQVRLCGRYRKLMANGKRRTVVVAAIAREMSAFLWAIGQQVKPRLADCFGSPARVSRFLPSHQNDLGEPNSFGTALKRAMPISEL